MKSYEDILHLPHHVSPVRQQMTMQERAAQFAPFAALTGHSAAITETARQTEQRVELDEYEIDALNARLQHRAARLHERPQVSITYFQPDERKSGGSYVTAAGVVKKIDADHQRLLLVDGTRIPMEDMIAITLSDFE